MYTQDKKHFTVSHHIWVHVTLVNKFDLFGHDLVDQDAVGDTLSQQILHMDEASIQQNKLKRVKIN